MPISRRALLKGFVGGAAGLLLPSPDIVEATVEPIKRYWSLDKTMITGDWELIKYWFAGYKNPSPGAPELDWYDVGHNTKTGEYGIYVGTRWIPFFDPGHSPVESNVSCPTILANPSAQGMPDKFMNHWSDERRGQEFAGYHPMIGRLIE